MRKAAAAETSLNDPGPAWLVAVACAVLRSFLFWLISPAARKDIHDMSDAEVIGLARMLSRGEARMNRAIIGAARAMAGLPPLRWPLSRYLMRVPRTRHAWGMRLLEHANRLYEPMKYARRMARRMKAAMAASAFAHGASARRVPMRAAAIRGLASCQPAAACPAEALRAKVEGGAADRSIKAVRQFAPARKHPNPAFTPCARSRARPRPRARAAQRFVHTKSASGETAH